MNTNGINPNSPILRMEWILPTGERFAFEQAISEGFLWPAMMPLPLIAGSIEQGQPDRIRQVHDARANVIQALIPAFAKFVQMALAQKDGKR